MRRPSAKEIASQNRYLLRAQDNFQIAAEYLAEAFSELDAVEKVVLFGSVALPLKKEVPQFSAYRRYGIEVWHECMDVDLAVWLGDLSVLKQLQRTRGQTLNRLLQEKNIGVAHHQVDVFIMEPVTDRYLGRLCNFGTCPKGKMDCHEPGCGKPLFLRQISGFKLKPQALAAKNCRVLFEGQSAQEDGDEEPAKVDVLIEGYAREENEDWYASPATVLIQDRGHNIIVDPGANKKKLRKALRGQRAQVKRH